jgi:hypothetical protein
VTIARSSGVEAEGATDVLDFDPIDGFRGLCRKKPWAQSADRSLVRRPSLNWPFHQHDYAS